MKSLFILALAFTVSGNAFAKEKKKDHHDGDDKKCYWYETRNGVKTGEKTLMDLLACKNKLKVVKFAFPFGAVCGCEGDDDDNGHHDS